MKSHTAAGLALTGILALSACGGGDGGGSEGGDGSTEVTVGAIPIVDTAPLWLGEDQGFFEDEGIDLDIQTTSGGAAAVPGVVSGDFDFAFGNLISVMVAQDQGLDIEFVANGTSSTGDVESDFGAVVVNEDSDIESTEDLEGKTVSVNNLSNIGDTTISYVVEEAGADPSTIDFVEIAFPDAPAALSNGQVDAAWILDPYLTNALNDGARVISYNYAETDPMLDIAGYFTNQDRIESDPDLVDSFATAMNRSLEFANENPDEVRNILTEYTQIDDETREEIVLPEFRPEFDLGAAELLGEYAAKYGTLDEEPDLDALFPEQ